VMRLPKAKLAVVVKGNGVNIVRGNTSLGTTSLTYSRLTWATFLPDAKLMLLGSYWPSDSCPLNGLDAIVIK
jgi:hypothetical protein